MPVRTVEVRRSVLLNQGDDSSILHEIAQKSRIILMSFFNLRYPHNESQIRLRFMRNKIIVLIVSDYSMMYKQHEKESEEDKKMALINAVLPNIQLRIKGVTVITILFPV